jgi:hypothetical protein
MARGSETKIIHQGGMQCLARHPFEDNPLSGHGYEPMLAQIGTSIPRNILSHGIIQRFLAQ